MVYKVHNGWAYKKLGCNVYEEFIIKCNLHMLFVCKSAIGAFEMNININNKYARKNKRTDAHASLMHKKI